MQLRGESPLFFATDLTNFLGCRHLTAVERLAAHKLAKRPYFDDPMLEILRERGLAHERAYVEHLAGAGKRVVSIERNSATPLDDTLHAMREGADVIVQARLEHGVWAGWADVLLRVAGRSSLGDWRYEPVETKLAKETRGATLVQLCLYAELLAELQGAAPEVLRVVVPESGFRPEIYRFDEFRAYFRLVRRNFEADIQTPLAASVEAATPYPDPVPHCDVCNWYSVCDRQRTADDHISLVAGIQKTQRKELAAWGVTTLAALAQLPIPLEKAPSRGSVDALVRVREQARLQFESRAAGRPVYELLPVEANHGLAALPEPSPLDVFLDLEGDRQAEDGGLEYLFGYVFRDAEGTVRYEALWALAPAEEKRAFETLIDLVGERRRVDPAMHVYHYAPYEPTAMKRLMGRYATRADELDDLLRGEVFVDLYSVIRKGVRAGVDSYSIKKLEPFYGLTREVDLRLASRQLRAVEYAIARKDAASLTDEIRDAVRLYNRDDCVSALELRDWLEKLRLEAEQQRGEPLPRPSLPEAPANEKLGDRLARIRAVAGALTAGLPPERNRDEQARWVLAQLLEWHRREDKVDWWEFFRLNDMAADELLDERAGIAGLRFERRLEVTKRGVVVDRYSFPPQDTEFAEQDAAYEPGCEKPSPVATVEGIDLEKRTLDLRKGVARADHHPTALFKQDKVSNPDAVDALLRLGEFVRDHGLVGPGPYGAARDLLLRSNPRLAGGESLRQPEESTVASARRAVVALDGSVLAIQGPPGAGKTFTGARMILDLVRAGKRVGVTAVSHKVIRNLLEEVVRAAAEEKVRLHCMHRVSEKSKRAPPGIYEETDSREAVSKIRKRNYNVVGGTAWVWSKADLAQVIDVLVVDEAGQMSLANVLACAQAATNLVLLGDPQQLEQPQKASHPEGSELSALEYLLEGHETMPEERGLFLGETWRLHPSICRYTSDLFYEGKLQPHAGLANQAVGGPTRFAGAGLFFVPVEHEGNQNVSVEEVAEVVDIVRDLLQPGVAWTDRHSEVRPLTLADILIVAPYNAQVSEIAERLPGARVGTVDKFQGQEAPVVIYSMATSNPEEAPHGMQFLFSRNRLNVATSRARCVCILVGNPRLFEPECRTPEQMRMANAFCAYLERATTAPISV
ncbi:MAG: TM0106 family RecB-like putative nuclease [Polyangiaceae bacterium]|nr:TM0106 family RecB-like putative nuclease [Polyangiaceae bacterium]